MLNLTIYLRNEVLYKECTYHLTHRGLQKKTLFWPDFILNFLRWESKQIF